MHGSQRVLEKVKNVEIVNVVVNVPQAPQPKVPVLFGKYYPLCGTFLGYVHCA